MTYDLKREEEVKEYVENLGIEYRFGCYQEKKPEVCHLLADYLEAIKKDFVKAAKVYKSNCNDYSFGKSCLKYGNYCLLGKGKDKSDAQEALTYFEKGCDLGEPGACLHAGVLLTATGPAVTVQRDVPKGNQFGEHQAKVAKMSVCFPTVLHNGKGEPEMKQMSNILSILFLTSFIMPTIGIIGGSGFDDPSLFESPIEKDVTTPFGKPSDVLLEGSIKGVPCVLLARHGRKHQYQPSDVNYRANIWALKQLGCTHVLATTATGSLVEQYKPGDLVVLDDFIDRTWGRNSTFYDRTEGGPKGVCHLPMKPAFCEKARKALLAAARSRGYICHETGTAITVQGPRFSSRAESLMHRQWGGHVVNMTTVPEVVLAKEAGLSYAAVALVTDYDCWRDNEQSVSVTEVLEMFARNIKKAIDVIVEAVVILAADADYAYLDCHKDLVTSAIMLKE